jgi:hypothetical protein
MEALLYLLPALGCGLMMVVMMVFMGRLMAPQQKDRPDEVAALRHEVERLRSESTDGTRVDG